MFENLNNAPAIVLSFIIIGILAGVGVLINSEVQDGIGKTTGYTVTNETILAVSNTSNVTLLRTSITNLTDIIVINASLNEEVAVGNWSVTEVAPTNGNEEIQYVFYLTDAGSGANTDNASYEGQDMNISYSGADFSDSATAIRNATRGVGNLTKQLPTVGTVFGVLLIVAAVIGLVGIFSYFRRGGGAY